MLVLDGDAADEADRDTKFLGNVPALALLDQSGMRDAHKVADFELVQLAAAILVAQSALLRLDLVFLLCEDLLPISLRFHLNHLLADRRW